MILVGAMTFTAATVFINVETGMSDADQRLNEHATKVLAREVAVSGLNRATQQVFDSFEASGSYTEPEALTGSHDGGSYQVDISTAGTSITLKAEPGTRSAGATPM